MRVAFIVLELKTEHDFIHFMTILYFLKRLIYIFVIFLLVVPKSVGTLDDVLSLEDCLKRARNVYIPLQIANEKVKLAKMHVSEARRNLFPTLSLEGEAIEGSTIGEDFRGRGLELRLQQPLWDGGKNWKIFQQAKLNLKKQKLNAAKIGNELEAEVKKAYAILWSAQKGIEERKKVIIEAEQILQSVRERWANQLIRKVDFLAALTQFQELQYTSNVAERDGALAQLSLKQILSLYDEEKLKIKTDLPLPSIPLSMEESVDLAITHRPEMELRKLDVDLARTQKEIVEKESGFLINLDGKIGYRAEAFESEELNYQEEFFVGLSGSFPLWGQLIESESLIQDSVPTSGQTTSTDFRSQTVRLNLFADNSRSKRLEAKIQYDQAVEEFHKTKRGILFEVGSAYFDYQKSIEGIEKAKETANLEAKRAELTHIKVGLLEANLSQLLEALSRESSAKIDTWNSWSASYLAGQKLSQAVGKPRFWDTPEEEEKVPYYNDISILETAY